MYNFSRGEDYEGNTKEINNTNKEKNRQDRYRYNYNTIWGKSEEIQGKGIDKNKYSIDSDNEGNKIPQNIQDLFVNNSNIQDIYSNVSKEQINEIKKKWEKEVFQGKPEQYLKQVIYEIYS